MEPIFSGSKKQSKALIQSLHTQIFEHRLRREKFFPLPDDLTGICSRRPNTDISPEERALNVGRVLRKEADDVMSRWERLGADSAEWQRRLEAALERLAELQEAQDLLDGQLRQAEMVKEAWEPVGDLSIDSLQDNMDRVKVSQTKRPWSA